MTPDADIGEAGGGGGAPSQRSAGLPTAAIVLSGNELLDGRTHDTNGAFVSDDLSRHGVKVLSLQVVADEARVLSSALRHALSLSPDLLLIGGGLGTTHDDLTAACLAAVLGVPLREHAGALRALRQAASAVARRRGLDPDGVLARARRQALLPEGAEPLPPAGLAPGILARHGRTRIVALPGVPHEFRSMWVAFAGRLAAEGFFPPVVVRELRCWGVGELQVGPLVEASPHDLVEVGVNVGGGEVTVRLRYDARTPGAEAQAEHLVATLVAGAPVYSRDGRTVDEMVADGLRGHAATLAVAESCTGGGLGARLTALPGSSDYFLGGVVSYANEVKAGVLGVPREALERHGAVSAVVADAMASGVRRLLGSDYALAITGVAGPGGGSPGKPVGLVYVALADPEGVTVERHHLPGDRAAVREGAASAALHLLRRRLYPPTGEESQ